MGAVQHEMCGRRRIVAAARRLFSTQGFHQTPMSELATAAGVSVGQIYRLFTNKDEVIRAIVLEDAEAKAEVMNQLLADVTSGRMTVEDGFVELARRFVDKENEALTFDIMAEGHRNSGVADTIGGLCIGFRKMIRDLACVANPTLSADDLDGAEEMLLAIMFGLGHRTLSNPTLSKEDTARMSGRMMLGAIRAV